MNEVIQVAIPFPPDDTFSYSIPPELSEGVKIGKRVLVPFKNRRVLGFVVKFCERPKGIELKDVIDVVDEEPLFDEKRLNFLRWVSKYYLTSLGVVLKAAHPGGLGVSLRKVVRVTRKGLDALRSDEVNSQEKLVLKTLDQTPQLAVRRLFNILDGLTHEVLNALRRKDLLEIDYELRSNPRVKTERILSASKNPEIDDNFRKRSPVKARILDFIQCHKRVPYAGLKELFGDVGRQIRELEKRELVTIKREEVLRDPFSAIPISREKPPELNPDQEIAITKISDLISRGIFSAFLLHGVTGSGKTEVYLRAIEKVIAKGNEAIVLVPEISLTPQIVKRFRGRFGKRVAVIHSALSEGDRFDAWRMASRGLVKVIIGARSAIFAPFKKLGIIVVDEEHESSYKQEENPCYNARDLSLVLGKMTNSVVLLGSATPSVETYANALRGKFTYLSLPLRVEDRALPELEVVDMKKEKDQIFSTRLKRAIVQNFGNKKQTILFLNRRGFSSLVVCQACGDILSCPNCAISLTYHSKDHSIRCHYCGIFERLMDHCNKCGADLKGIGMGTQKIEAELERLLPSARISRMDRDEIAGKNRLLKLYSRLESGEVDILIGTQMVAKGHDLPGVTLVGVVSADISLGIPDFRASERTFQLVTQVAGRAGRGDEPGRVIVQTYNPEHPSIKFAIDQDSVGFLSKELKLREDLQYPPYFRLVNFRFQGKFEPETANTAKKAGEIAKNMAARLPIGALSVLGPSPAPITRIRNQYRYQMVLRSSKINVLHSFSKKLLGILKENVRTGIVKVAIDVDPINFN